jgi:hypothetical protein
MTMLQPQNPGKDYQVNALGRIHLPREAFANTASLRELLDGKAHPQVIERLERLVKMDDQGSTREELLRQLLEAASPASVSFQERFFAEAPEEENVITLSIDESGNVTVMLG